MVLWDKSCPIPIVKAKLELPHQSQVQKVNGISQPINQPQSQVSPGRLLELFFRSNLFRIFSRRYEIIYHQHNLWTKFLDYN